MGSKLSITYETLLIFGSPQPDESQLLQENISIFWNSRFKINYIGSTGKCMKIIFELLVLHSHVNWEFSWLQSRFPLNRFGREQNKWGKYINICIYYFLMVGPLRAEWTVIIPEKNDCLTEWVRNEEGGVKINAYEIHISIFKTWSFTAAYFLNFPSSTIIILT